MTLDSDRTSSFGKSGRPDLSLQCVQIQEPWPAEKSTPLFLVLVRSAHRCLEFVRIRIWAITSTDESKRVAHADYSAGRISGDFIAAAA